jgi:hypothetical protein
VDAERAVKLPSTCCAERHQNSLGYLVRSIAIVFAGLLFALPSVAVADCRSEIADIVNRLYKHGAFERTTTNSIDGAATISRLLFAPPDQFDVLSSTGSTIVHTTNGLWTESNGKFVRKAEGAREIIKSMVLNTFAETLDRMSNEQCGGLQNYEGKRHETYSYTIGGSDLRNSMTIVLDDLRRPAWIVSTAKAGKSDLKSVHQFRYDETITIADPE